MQLSNIFALAFGLLTIILTVTMIFQKSNRLQAYILRHFTSQRPLLPTTNGPVAGTLPGDLELGHDLFEFVFTARRRGL
ncbi:unnamed protein product [Zymoseptoria tritici ST99CH_1A5]|uniref:Uncharacterized protein n=3 Tax=Zymoseptoria tritici TaxID=1047171 RepID=A0A1X7RWT8_ZYMT9|nr:unnamed protein product [Zymoseptoria tritici ST99CH_3D7]SMR53986.1 unnamed protein product [Zymoseptoria tritici ST99CH_1E4]SMY25361.1 unnamed protein product [Zymoseptoria tritici ST99CH_1A5]